MKILFAGGGTAGHINPALAVAGYIKEKAPDTEILFVGNRGGMEQTLVPKAGFKMEFISISGFSRSLSMKSVKHNVETFNKTFTASKEAKRIISQFNPDICVGTGGYVSGPVLRTAAKMGIPTVIHEQNAYPGITNKMLARTAKRVMLAVKDAEDPTVPSLIFSLESVFSVLAGAVISIIIPLVAFIIGQSYLIKGMTAGAVKG